MICPNQPLHCDAYIRFGSAGEPLRWYISQPAKWGPVTSQFWRLPSDVRTNAPLRVPTSTLTLLICSLLLMNCVCTHRAKSKPIVQKPCCNPPLALAAKRQQRAQPCVAKEKTSPPQDAENDHGQVGRVTNAHVAGGGTTEIGSHQNRAKIGSLRNDVDESAGDLENSEEDNLTFGIPIMSETLDDGHRLQQFHDAAEEQHQYRQGANDTSGPELFP